MNNLVLLRHGQSQWNLENRFTGWTDVDLTEQGINEAKNAALELKNIKFDCVFTSTLLRAERTAEIVIKECGYHHSYLNKSLIRCDFLKERDYGDLVGLNKDETREQYGEEQVHIWRRSYDVRPPNGESLKDVYKRCVFKFQEEIEPLVLADKNILICAHGNSLRSIIKYLLDLDNKGISNIEVNTGEPITFVYEFGRLINVLDKSSKYVSIVEGLFNE